MAKKSKIVREYKIIKNVQKYSALRADLKSIIKNPNISVEEKEVAGPDWEQALECAEEGCHEDVCQYD